MLAVGIGPIGPIEGLIILAIVVLIFGVGKLADVGGALGKSVREFRKAAREPEKDDDEPQQLASSDAPSCSSCGAPVNGNSRFCAECGQPVQATAN